MNWTELKGLLIKVDFSTTCPILSMLLIHTTSGPPAQRPESFPDILDCQALHLPCHQTITVTFPNYTTRKKALWYIKLIITIIIIIIIKIGMCNQMVTSEIREWFHTRFIRIWTKLKWDYSLISWVYQLITHWYNGWRIAFLTCLSWFYRSR